MAAGIAIARPDHTASELRTVAGKCDDAAQVRRLLALATAVRFAESQLTPTLWPTYLLHRSLLGWI